MPKTLTLTRSAAVTLAGWSQVSGALTSPAAFATLTSTPVPAGPVTITWTVTLAGTVGGGSTIQTPNFPNLMICDPGSTVTIVQDGALTVGAATAFIEIWAL